MFGPHRGAVQADANRGVGIVQASIVGTGSDNVLHSAAGKSVAGKSAGHKRSHQHSGNGSVAVRKMEDVRFI